jgi:UDP-GlcNAc:undecaprenyl-phosphate GlcNAc-1-phosphate transferase
VSAAAAGTSFLAALLLAPLAAALARRAGFLDRPGPRKIHAEPVPYGGGLAVALAVACGMRGGLAEQIPLLVAAGTMLLLGLVDDAITLSPRVKLAAQAAAALGLAPFGFRLELFDLGPVPGTLVTLAWIVGITNAFNLLDHMDGLSGGVAAICAAALLWTAEQTGQAALAAALAALGGALLGFLPWNFPKARLFLGDAGSLFVGFWLAALTVKGTFYRPPYPLYTYLVPLAVFAVPLYDTASVLLLRLRARAPLFQGDTRHFAHRLVSLGLSRPQAVLSVYVLACFTGLSAALIYQVRESGALLVLGQVLLAFLLIGILEGAAHRRAP